MEIVWALAQGRTASEVADQLYLSVRTIENRLHRVYRTLDVHGREELAALLSPVPRPANWQMSSGEQMAPTQ
ncbi:MAG: helix-turn-helix transcriptional regulator [Ornithinimicrobium sp.]